MIRIRRSYDEAIRSGVTFDWLNHSVGVRWAWRGIVYRTTIRWRDVRPRLLFRLEVHGGGTQASRTWGLFPWKPSNPLPCPICGTRWNCFLRGYGEVETYREEHGCLKGHRYEVNQELSARVVAVVS